MILKILGGLDIFTGIVFLLSFKFSFIPESLILILGIILLIKGGIFSLEPNFGSVLDIISSFILIGSVYFSIPFFVFLSVFIFLLQKGLFSFLGSE